MHPPRDNHRILIATRPILGVRVLHQLAETWSIKGFSSDDVRWVA